MKRKECFLNNPGVMDAVLQAALVGGLKEAINLDAKLGAVAAAIVVNGELHLQSRALGGNIVTENDPDKKWDDDSNIGINYTGYAIGKLMQSIRTGDPSKEGSALGYGESNDAGSDREICFCRNYAGEKVRFLLVASYSGMGSSDDYWIAQTACHNAWLEMFGYKNSNGSDISLCRIAGSCPSC